MNVETKLDTIEDHHNKHTIGDQGCSWTNYSLDNLFGCCFFWVVLIRHPIFWEIKHFENSKRMEQRKTREQY